MLDYTFCNLYTCITVRVLISVLYMSISPTQNQGWGIHVTGVICHKWKAFFLNNLVQSGLHQHFPPLTCLSRGNLSQHACNVQKEYEHQQKCALKAQPLLRIQKGYVIDVRYSVALTERWIKWHGVGLTKSVGCQRIYQSQTSCTYTHPYMCMVYLRAWSVALTAQIKWLDV